MACLQRTHNVNPKKRKERGVAATAAILPGL